MVDRVKFAEILQFVAITLKGEELSDKELAAYYFALADEFSNIEEFKKVAKRVIKEWKYSYFPKPNHFISSRNDFNHLDIEIIAQKAWESVIEAVEAGVGYSKSAEFEDRLIPAVVSLCGGFKFLGTKGYEELSWIKKEFIKIYKSALNGRVKLQVREVTAQLQNCETLKIKATYPIPKANFNTPQIADKPIHSEIKELANLKRM